MNNKYYTPTIGEFYDGFECETNYCLFNSSKKDHQEFEPLTLTKDNISYMLDAYIEDAYPSEFRVKYLDKEDIESFGFKQTIEDQYYKDDFELLIDDDLFIQIMKDDGFVFQGTIKNKSELKRILKMIGYGN